MLTRLKVNGFKNLVETEIYFGPFTCIAGANNAGKSNIFDAIMFLGRLADTTFVEAADQIRGGNNVESLFSAGKTPTMDFECDILVGPRGEDDFLQNAQATHTFLTYRLSLQLDKTSSQRTRIRLTHEELKGITAGLTQARLPFAQTKKWIESVVIRPKRTASYISTKTELGAKRIRLSRDKMGGSHQKKRGGGKPVAFLAESIPRTALSAAQNAEEARTAVLVRKEMRNWRTLQLEPSALREPDSFQADEHLTATGRHLPATMARLAATGNDPSSIYAEIANRTRELVDDIKSVRVDRDEHRRLLTLFATNNCGIELPASSLSDGTLRFLALAVMEMDRSSNGLICLEEPENGIFPERMAVMLNLLREMTSDTREVCDELNPLRQMIVTTHSPVVAGQCDAGDLLLADHRDAPGVPAGRLRSLVLRSLKGQWRSRLGISPASAADVARFVDCGSSPPPDDHTSPHRQAGKSARDEAFRQLRLFGDTK